MCILNETKYLLFLRKFLSSGSFYFKHTSDLNCKFDITLNAQLRNLNAQTESKFLWFVCFLFIFMIYLDLLLIKSINYLGMQTCTRHLDAYLLTRIIGSLKLFAVVLKLKKF